MIIGEAKRLKQVEEENTQLKRIVADSTIDMTTLKVALSKNGEVIGYAKRLNTFV